jgi:trehalose/maltose transport system substrate-binding protein
MIRKISWVALAFAVLFATAAFANGQKESGASSSGAAKSAGPATINIAGGAVGNELKALQDEANAWAAKTGNKVVVVNTPNSSSDRLALFQQQLAAGSSSTDVYQIDVVWPGLLGDYFVDLNKYIPKSDTSQFFPRIIENNTFKGNLVAIPWFTDAGLLFYRSDLLKKYGYSAPPKTWAELTTMAQKIQAGERQAGNADFWGYVWQGNAYEGLTCDALEWVKSNGGGTIIDGNGNITIDNPQAVDAIKLAASWVGTISPKGVTGYMEEDSRGVWQAGNAAFMRNWPYAYQLGEGKDSPIKGKFDVAALPKGSGPNASGADTLGGWNLAVSRFSKNPKEAASLVQYLTSYDVELERAMPPYSFLPTRPAVYKDSKLASSANSFIVKLLPVFENAVARPATIAKSKYNQVSSAFWTSVHNVLTGQQQAAPALKALKSQLESIKGSAW